MWGSEVAGRPGRPGEGVGLRESEVRRTTVRETEGPEAERWRDACVR